MALITPTPAPKRLQIDLSGPEGNAFVLLGYATRIGQQLGYDDDQIKKITTEMKSSDYEHLVITFDRHFGQVVDLILPPNWTWKEHETRLSPEEASSVTWVQPTSPLAPEETSLAPPKLKR